MTTNNKQMRAGRRPASGPPMRLHNGMQVELVPTASLKLNPESARRFSRSDERLAREIVKANDPIPPLLVDDQCIVRTGEALFRAAQQLHIQNVPVIRISDMSEAKLQALSVAYQRLGELGEWDREQLVKLNLRFEVEIPDYQPESIGFGVGALDVMIGELADDAGEDFDLSPSAVPVTKVGDVWILDKHRLICGDSISPSTFARLMSGTAAAMVFTDPPFGCPINGFVAGEGRHREFVMGSGEMSPDELAAFFGGFIAAMLPYVKKGAVVELVIDWRSLHQLLDAAAPLLGPLINMAVWVKDRPGQGSFLRSQHELILIFKAGKGRFLNNVQLGRDGRSRSNIWSYPSAKTASKGSDEGNMLENHPTPKGVRLVADAILDCTRRGDVVLDCFLGSGTTLIAAEKVGRICCAAELDPLYVDLAVRRWQAWTGQQAVHEASGRTFDEIEAETIRNN